MNRGAVLSRFGNEISSIALSPDGRRLATIKDDDKTVQIWEIASGEVSVELTGGVAGHIDVITSVGWSPDGERIISGSKDKSVRIWDVMNGEVLAVLLGHSEEVSSVAWSPDGRYLTSVGVSGGRENLRKWDTITWEEVEVLDEETSFFDGFSRSMGNFVVWSLDGKELYFSDEQTQIAYSSDGHWFASSYIYSNRGRSIFVAELESPDHYPVNHWKLIHGNRVRSLAWSPYSQLLASGGEDGVVRIWGRPTDD